MAHLTSNDPFLGDEPANCHFCEAPAHAYWHFELLNFYVCSECALEKLPLLMSDAVTAHNPNANLDTAMEVISRNFYRGAAIGLQLANDSLRKAANQQKAEDDDHFET